jgi:uncharacterized protein
VKASCYSSPKLKGRDIPEKGFKGLFATEKISAGELLTLYMGDLIDRAILDTLPSADQVHILQIEEDLYIKPIREEEAHYVNHSCEPNAGMAGQISVIALRDIEAGEEICFDYAMCDGSPYDEFTCLCGSAQCRKTISGNDWQRPELWERYKGYFSPYLQRRIDKLQNT